MRACQPKDVKRREWWNAPVCWGEREKECRHMVGGGGERERAHAHGGGRGRALEQERRVHARRGERGEERERARESKRKSARMREKGRGRREREKALWPLLLYVFLLPLGLPYANWAYLGVLFFLSEVFTPVLGPSFDLPLFYFHGLFPSLSFSHHHFGLLFPILTPNNCT